MVQMSLNAINAIMSQMHKPISYEPQSEVTEINSLCKETLTKIEPKCEEELNSSLLNQDFEISEDCYDGHNTLKQEPNDFTTIEE
ncbi:hypothetical protein RI129_010125, partial [Pyrocoelia pectoralis]